MSVNSAETVQHPAALCQRTQNPLLPKFNPRDPKILYSIPYTVPEPVPYR